MQEQERNQPSRLDQWHRKLRADTECVMSTGRRFASGADVSVEIFDGDELTRSVGGSDVRAVAFEIVTPRDGSHSLRPPVPLDMKVDAVFLHLRIADAHRPEVPAQQLGRGRHDPARSGDFPQAVAEIEQEMGCNLHFRDRIRLCMWVGSRRC